LILGIAKTSVSGEVDLQAVVTVPSYFPNKSVQTVRDIVEKSGFSVLQVIDEASAAVLATVPPEKSGKCLVCRIGGISLDVTLIDIHEGFYTILSDVHKFDCGGR